MAQSNSPYSLNVSIRSRQGLVFEGQVQTVSSYNRIGLFDVLPRHANFVSMIKDKVILVKPDKKRLEITLDTGVMMVQENNVQIFLGVGKI